MYRILRREVLHWSVCVFLRYTTSFTVTSSFRVISLSMKGRGLSLSSSYVNLLLPVVSMLLRHSVSSRSHPLLTTSITSSTFHSFDLYVIGDLRIACSSSHSMKRFVIIDDTGLPIAEPNFC